MNGMNPQEILGSARRGYFYDDLAEAFQRVVPSAMGLQKKGTITITLSIEPEDNGETCKFSASIVAKPPVSSGGAKTMYATPEGMLTPVDPRQRDMGEVVDIETSRKPVEDVGAKKRSLG